MSLGRGCYVTWGGRATPLGQGVLCHLGRGCYVIWEGVLVTSLGGGGAMSLRSDLQCSVVR